ncbi:MAG: hypothetical protein AB8B85_12405 [Paracoccaceae bacterium]
MRATPSILLLSLIMATPVSAVEDYDSCLALVEADPEAAEREAGDWARYGGGGAGARHCYALALLAIGAEGRAIDELIGAALEEPGLADDARADLLVQAGELLIEVEDFVTAAIVAEQALRLAPRGAAVLGLRGAVKVANGDVAAGIRDLGQAMDEGGADPRWLLRRAAAYRLRGELVAARDDAKFAVELAPGDPAVWLEQGRIEGGLGETANARQSLLMAIELDRSGRVGRAAQVALQRMEAGIQ